ncbi:MAG: F0F1 ATP synthase subunit delta [Bacillus sp. (in: Bacteria)]|nr:F0F1 ATP synthase subunit delta [Bacillus sp. (in: firmicutes)]MCM1425288.1 F0F1 ATP synthase subunit delta [Eubacterium sp.]
MAKLISKTYGDALFELAVEENKVDSLLEEIEQLQKVLKENDEFGKLMTHPKINKEEKLQVVTNVFKGRISDELLGFITIIISKDRYQEIDEILEYFLAEVKKYKGIGVATVTTAVPLREEQCKQIEQKLLDTTDYRSMEMNYKLDAALIGGMVIRIGDRVVDSSISTKLSELQKDLLKVQI